jgi:hypothetical protein
VGYLDGIGGIRRRRNVKIAYKNFIYEAVNSMDTEKKILAAVKNAPKFDESKENKLYRVGGVVRDEIFGAKSKDIDYLLKLNGGLLWNI